MNANLPMKKQGNMFGKIVNFFKKVFGIKDKEIYNNVEVKSNGKENSNGFLDSIRLSNIVEENQTKEIMREYEQGILKVTDMSKKEITDLIELCNKEIKQLKEKISTIKSQMTARKNKITM